jgi:hypothetical protein
VRTNPLSDSWAFLIGQSDFHREAGTQGIFMVPLFYALVIASIVIAIRNWSADPEQRTAHHAFTWFFRTMIGVMWFEGSVWKLPLPLSAGFPYWIDQMVIHAGFDWHRWIVVNVFKTQPLLSIMNIGIFFIEVGLAASFMLGFAVRGMAFFGIGIAFHLYLGLFRHPAEWPWLFIFLIFVQGFFIMHAAGRSLGLDAMFRRNASGPYAREDAIGRVYRLAS